MMLVSAKSLELDAQIWRGEEKEKEKKDGKKKKGGKKSRGIFEFFFFFGMQEIDKSKTPLFSRISLKWSCGKKKGGGGRRKRGDLPYSYIKIADSHIPKYVDATFDW